MEVKNLQALIVLRNHAQAILNGLRADLKLTKEDKTSLMNGLKKVDEIFIKNFENCVEPSNVSTKVRSWTSTDSEESVLSRAISLAVASAASSVTSDTTDKSVSVSVEFTAPTVAKVDSSSVTTSSDVVESGSVVKTVPVTTLEKTKKTKKGFSRA